MKYSTYIYEKLTFLWSQYTFYTFDLFHGAAQAYCLLHIHFIPSESCRPTFGSIPDKFLWKKKKSHILYLSHSGWGGVYCCKMFISIFDTTVGFSCLEFKRSVNHTKATCNIVIMMRLHYSQWCLLLGLSISNCFSKMICMREHLWEVVSKPHYQIHNSSDT